MDTEAVLALGARNGTLVNGATVEMYSGVIGLAAAAALVFAAFGPACSSSARYPACERDQQCAVGAKHDYCVGGRCVYCRSAVDCGEREMCRAGECKPDPNAPPPPVLDAGEDGETDEAGSAEDDAGESQVDDEPAPPRILPRGVRRILRP